MNGLSKRQGLRTKIIAWSFFPTLIILATVALVTYAAYQNVTDDLVLAKDQELTRLSASQLSTEMRAYTDLLTEIANTTDLRQVDPELQRAALERFSNRLVVFDGGVVTLDNFGVLVAALPNRPEDLGQDWSNRERCSRRLQEIGLRHCQTIFLADQIFHHLPGGLRVKGPPVDTKPIGGRKCDPFSGACRERGYADPEFRV